MAAAHVGVSGEDIMDYTTQLGANGKYIETKMHNPVTKELALKSQADANELAAQHNLERFLVDVRNISTQTGTLGDVMVAKELPQTGLSVSSRIAILASPHDDQHDFIETTAQNRGVILRVFKKEDAAVAWLSE